MRTPPSQITQLLSRASLEVATHRFEQPCRAAGRLIAAGKRRLRFGMIKELTGNEWRQKLTRRGNVNYTVRSHPGMFGRRNRRVHPHRARAWGRSLRKDKKMSNRPHLMTIAGNRPQFIKMAPLSAELARRGYREFVVHTGQHSDDNMSEVFFEELNLPKPDIRLVVGERQHGAMTAEMLKSLEHAMLDHRPPWVLIFGDTNSTLAAALAAVKLRIPIAHVEAGPRIYDIDTPEEINRIVADHAARLRFCPDVPSVMNLARENVSAGVHLTGDVMFDAFLHFSRIADERSSILETLRLRKKRFALLTTHRPNNTDDPKAQEGLVRLLRESALPVVFPTHPRTENALRRNGFWDTVNALEHVHITPALGYLDILVLVNHAEVVLTDSGGLQKEAYFAGKPVGVLFYATPWPRIEAVGWQRRCWVDNGINVEAALDVVARYRPTASRPSFFGDGNAAGHIVDILESEGWLARPT
ncbi:MAG: non-hydrolyzing UDP-N-acetylglucosamine 2-epimerase [Gemmatimonadaceae bacterium]